MNDYNLFKEKKKNKNMRINTKAMMMMMIGRHDMGLQSAFVRIFIQLEETNIKNVS